MLTISKRKCKESCYLQSILFDKGEFNHIFWKWKGEQNLKPSKGHGLKLFCLALGSVLEYYFCYASWHARLPLSSKECCLCASSVSKFKLNTSSFCVYTGTVLSWLE